MLAPFVDNKGLLVRDLHVSNSVSLKDTVLFSSVNQFSSSSIQLK